MPAIALPLKITNPAFVKSSEVTTTQPFLSTPTTPVAADKFVEKPKSGYSTATKVGGAALLSAVAGGVVAHRSGWLGGVSKQSEEAVIKTVKNGVETVGDKIYEAHTSGVLAKLSDAGSWTKDNVVKNGYVQAGAAALAVLIPTYKKILKPLFIAMNNPFAL